MAAYYLREVPCVGDEVVKIEIYNIEKPYKTRAVALIFKSGKRIEVEYLDKDI